MDIFDIKYQFHLLKQFRIELAGRICIKVSNILSNSNRKIKAWKHLKIFFIEKYYIDYKYSRQLECCKAI